MAKSEQFYELLKQERKNFRLNRISMDKVRYESVINKVMRLKFSFHLEGNDYRFLRRYDVIEIDGVTKLISPLSEGGTFKYFLTDEDLFEVFNEAHIITCHGGRDRMVKYLKSKYQNITYKDVSIFLSLCEICLQKRKIQTKGNDTVKPLTIIKELNHRCQVDFIDFESQPDGDYKFILVYRDELTQFVVLRALKSKTDAEICEHLIDIFSSLGAPLVLQSDNSREFVNKIMNEIKHFWPNFKIVHGKPSYGQSQESINQRVNQDIKNMLIEWMNNHNTSNWSYGLKFVQLKRNSVLQSGIERSPYESMFGCPPQDGLDVSSIPTDALQNVESEEDLEAIIKKINLGNKHHSEDDLFRGEPSSSGIVLPCFEQENRELPSHDTSVMINLVKSNKEIKRLEETNREGISLSDQVKLMKSTSDRELQTVDQECFVGIPIFKVERYREDTRSTNSAGLNKTNVSFGTRNSLAKELHHR